MLKSNRLDPGRFGNKPPQTYHRRSTPYIISVPIFIVGFVQDINDWCHINRMSPNYVRAISSVDYLRGLSVRQLYFVGDWDQLPDIQELLQFAESQVMELIGLPLDLRMGPQEYIIYGSNNFGGHLIQRY